MAVITRHEQIEAFLACTRIAIVGLSRNRSSLSRTVATALRATGHEVAPVNPACSEIDGMSCAARIRDIAPPPDAVLIMTSPALAATAVRDALAASVTKIWLYGTGRHGVATPQALTLCAQAGVEPIVNLCPLMFLNWGSVLHNLHGRWVKFTGRVTTAKHRVHEPRG